MLLQFFFSYPLARFQGHQWLLHEHAIQVHCAWNQHLLLRGTLKVFRGFASDISVLRHLQLLKLVVPRGTDFGTSLTYLVQLPTKYYGSAAEHRSFPPLCRSNGLQRRCPGPTSVESSWAPPTPPAPPRDRCVSRSTASGLSLAAWSRRSLKFGFHLFPKLNLR